MIDVAAAFFFDTRDMVDAELRFARYACCFHAIFSCHAADATCRHAATVICTSRIRYADACWLLTRQRR